MSSKIRASLTLLTLCALVQLFISGRVWITANFVETNSPTLILPITGRALDPLGAGCAWALLASVLAYAVSRGAIRRVVSVVMIVLSGATLASSWNLHGKAISAQVDSITSQAVGRTVIAVNFSSNYLWLAAVTCAGICLVSAIFLTLAPGAPVKPRRYDRAENATDLSPWQALDAGLDPTQD